MQKIKITEKNKDSDQPYWKHQIIHMAQIPKIGLLTLIEEFSPKETCLKQIIMDPFCLEILNNESF